MNADKLSYNGVKTKFAPAGRSTDVEIQHQYKSMKKSEFLDKVFSKIPLMFLILNENRQIIYSNSLLAETLGYKELEELLSYRPGEALLCVNANIEEGGCGTSENCKYCGAIQSIMESKKTGVEVSKELLLKAKREEDEESFEYEVTTKPFEWEKKRYYMMTLSDISSQKRKEQLERVFFHDLLNKAGSVDGLVNIMADANDQDQIERLRGFIKRGMKELVDDILFQREFNKAENNELVVKFDVMSSLDILRNIQSDFLAMISLKNINVIIDDDAEGFTLMSDKILLNRILVNLTKNAMEASPTNSDIILNVKQFKNAYRFSVNNPTVMHDNVKKQMFKRSFSTKGPGRGIGTYSVKLFTEKYLGGKVFFTPVLCERHPI